MAGREEPPKLNVTFDAALSYGNVFALHELWKDLGFDRNRPIWLAVTHKFLLVVLPRYERLRQGQRGGRGRAI